jgi:hypothetical protein
VLHCDQQRIVAANVATALPRAQSSDYPAFDVNPYTSRFAGIFYAPESTRTTTPYTQDKALNRIRPA